MKLSLSIKIPYWKTFHFGAGKLVGESRPAVAKGLAHYDQYGRPTGKSVRNLVGELNHYDCRGRCIGYSRKSGLGKLNHFDGRGQHIGTTWNLLHFVFIHI